MCVYRCFERNYFFPPPSQFNIGGTKNPPPFFFVKRGGGLPDPLIFTKQTKSPQKTGGMDK